MYIELTNGSDVAVCHRGNRIIMLCTISTVEGGILASNGNAYLSSKTVAACWKRGKSDQTFCGSIGQ